MALTRSSRFGLRAVSRVPSGLRRAKWLQATGGCDIVVNPPPTRILPSGCKAMALTERFALGSKPSSAPSAAASLARWFRACDTGGTPELTLVKSPPRTIIPSDCTASDRTAPAAVKPVKLPSSRSAEVKRARCDPGVVKLPPSTRLAFCIIAANTSSFVPPEKFPFSEPSTSESLAMLETLAASWVNLPATMMSPPGGKTMALMTTIGSAEDRGVNPSREPSFLKRAKPVRELATPLMVMVSKLPPTTMSLSWGKSS